MRTIGTLEDLARAWTRRNDCDRKLYAKFYVVELAIDPYLAQFATQNHTAGRPERESSFRTIAPFEVYLYSAYSALSRDEKASFAQQARARQPRIRITENGRTMRSVVSAIALLHSNREKKAKELWPILTRELRLLGLEPKEVIDPSDAAMSTAEQKQASVAE